MILSVGKCQFNNIWNLKVYNFTCRRVKKNLAKSIAFARRDYLHLIFWPAAIDGVDELDKSKDERDVYTSLWNEKKNQINEN